MLASRTAADWYQAQERAYAEQHQGCAYCGGTHCVRRVQGSVKKIYNCQRCDFQVSFEIPTRHYHMVRGEDVSVGSETMLEQPILNFQ